MRKLNYLFVLPDLKGFWPSGLAIVSAYLRARGFNVFCINTTLHAGGIVEVIRGQIESNNVDVVCTGGMSVYYDEINVVLYAAKLVKPSIIRVVGGPVVTSDPDLSLKLLDYDIGVIGEGEETMADLAVALEAGRNLREVAGLIFRADGQVVRTVPRGALEDLNSLPIPDYEGFEFQTWSRTIRPDPYLSSFSLVDRPIVGEIITSRSCPFSCTFCYHPLGKKYRTRDLDHVFREIDLLVNKYRVNFLNVQDELFSVKKQRMIEFADRIKPYNIIWFPQFRVTDADVGTLRYLKESGMHTVGLGVESISDKVLTSMRKKISKAQIELAYAAAREVKVAPIGNLIFGDEEETDETVDESLSWWKSHPETPLNIGLVKAIPDAKIYRDALERGLIADKETFVRNKFPTINMSKISPEKFKWLQGHVTAAYYGSVLANAFGKVTRSKINAESSASDAYVDLEARCPSCKAVSRYEKFPYLGLANVRVICRNHDCCRELLLDSRKVYAPLLSLRRVGLKAACRARVQILLHTRPQLVERLRGFGVVNVIYRKLIRRVLVTG